MRAADAPVLTNIAEFAEADAQLQRDVIALGEEQIWVGAVPSTRAADLGGNERGGGHQAAEGAQCRGKRSSYVGLEGEM